MSRLAALSVDLDEIPNYFGIHGLPPPTGAAATLVYDRALERLGALARELDVPLTLFAIGADLQRPASAAALRGLVESGHEPANHSLDHRYDLTRLSRAEQAQQVRGGAEAVEEATGVRPVGFRAPGYTVTDTLLAEVAGSGALYDSSVFPCPPYWAAKAAVLGAMRVVGRRSRSILDTPRVLGAPTAPYRLGTPYWRRGSGLVELPIQVTRGLRLHYIGTTLTLAGPTGARWLTRAVVGAPLVNLELHGIDVLDVTDGLHALAPHQPDVRVPVARKLETLRVVVGTLRAAGYRFVCLREAAAAVA